MIDTDALALEQLDRARVALWKLRVEVLQEAERVLEVVPVYADRQINVFKNYAQTFYYMFTLSRVSFYNTFSRVLWHYSEHKNELLSTTTANEVNGDERDSMNGGMVDLEKAPRSREQPFRLKDDDHVRRHDGFQETRELLQIVRVCVNESGS